MVPRIWTALCDVWQRLDWYGRCLLMAGAVISLLFWRVTLMVLIAYELCRFAQWLNKQ